MIAGEGRRGSEGEEEKPSGRAKRAARNFRDAPGRPRSPWPNPTLPVAAEVAAGIGRWPLGRLLPCGGARRTVLSCMHRTYPDQRHHAPGKQVVATSAIVPVPYRHHRPVGSIQQCSLDYAELHSQLVTPGPCTTASLQLDILPIHHQHQGLFSYHFSPIPPTHRWRPFAP